TIDLKEKPQDMALSGDGSTAYILADGKVLVYSMREGKVTGDIPVKGKFSSISVAPKSGELFLADEAGKKITVVSISEVFNIPIGKSPAIGNKDAKVTLYAFLDYQ
ncbi:MAG: hypothetical protein GY850_40305, partial [bacterium]|nr:hypothetical protein [bacterium]